MKSKRMERQSWIKNNLLMILRGSIRVRNMLNSTISMSYPDVVIACIEHKVSLEAFRQLRQRWWSTIAMWRIIPGGWLITITANHSNYLVCDRASTQSVTVKAGKTAAQLLQCPRIKWIYNIVCSGGKNAGCSFFITLIDVYALFFGVSLRRQASTSPGWNSGPFLLRRC